MPLFYAQHINDSARLAVWHIQEEEDFFRKLVTPQTGVSHPHKRLQHLAGRYLLKILEPEFPVKEIALDGRRPFLKSNTWYFSISHCGDFAAAVISKKDRVGIDVEMSTEKLIRLKDKFLSGEEQQMLSASEANHLSFQKKLTACWSAKEAMYKWYAKGKVDFRKDMVIREIEEENEGFVFSAVFQKDVVLELRIAVRFYDELCLAWVLG